MRILFSVHLFVPSHLCGAERFIYHIIKNLQSQGHEVRVLLHQAELFNVKVPYVYDDIEVFGNTGNILQYDWADVLVTHLDFTAHTIGVGQIIKKPVVCIVHNTHIYQSISVAPKVFVVYNCEWAKNLLHYSHPSIVLTPPCDYRYYNVCPDPISNEYITLISLNHNKGGELFYEIAKRMPHKKFLGVTGSYDPQIKKDLPNVTIIDKQVDIRPVYAKTRILLMPSLYESWGMTGTEAMSNGIPVIACPTPGLKENLGDAGIFMTAREWVDEKEKQEKPYNVDQWVKAINKLDNEDTYRYHSVKSRNRSIELDPKRQLEEFEQFLFKAVYGMPVEA